MTRKERFEKKLRELEGRRNRLAVSGNYVRAMELDADIKRVREMIAQAEEYERRPVAQMLTREELVKSNIIPKVIACVLAGDLVNALAYEITDTCRGMGLKDVTVSPAIQTLVDASGQLGRMLTDIDPVLCSLVCDNETLVKTLISKIYKYMSQRLADAPGDPMNLHHSSATGSPKTRLP